MKQLDFRIEKRRDRIAVTFPNYRNNFALAAWVPGQKTITAMCFDIGKAASRRNNHHRPRPSCLSCQQRSPLPGRDQFLYTRCQSVHRKWFGQNAHSVFKLILGNDGRFSITGDKQNL
jgi:hypothetical protein